MASSQPAPQVVIYALLEEPVQLLAPVPGIPTLPNGDSLRWAHLVETGLVNVVFVVSLGSNVVTSGLVEQCNFWPLQHYILLVKPIISKHVTLAA